MIEKNKLKLNIDVPFFKNNQEGYPGYGTRMKKNFIFEDTLYYKDFTRGRSSLKFCFENAKGNCYEMFATNFSDLVKNQDISQGVFGKWSFVKKGVNFGLVKIIE